MPAGWKEKLWWRGFDKAELQVVIGDGAVWIWNMASELFPNAIQIIDLYHSKGTNSKAAKEIFGVENEIGKQWGKEHRDDLEAGRIDKILNKLEPFLRNCEEADSCRKYLIKNKERLRYPHFRKMGLCTSSGIVESGCSSCHWCKGEAVRNALDGSGG